jgi:hypothetical protein
MTFIATVENDMIKLPPGVHVPDGTRVSIEISGPDVAVPSRTLAERYSKFMGLADDLPEDMAKNHDHYLRGAPKRS